MPPASIATDDRRIVALPTLRTRLVEALCFGEQRKAADLAHAIAVEYGRIGVVVDGHEILRQALDLAPERAAHRAADTETAASRLLGHSRRQITSCYLGSPRASPPSVPANATRADGENGTELAD